MPRVSRAYLDRRRGEILAAAERCFAREGFHRATMQDVVAESGLSPGAIYRYFRGKRQIIAALAAERHARERAVLAAASRGEDLAGTLRHLLDAFVGGLSEPRERARRRLGIQLWAEALRDPELRALVRRGIRGPRRVVANAALRAQRRGELPAGLHPGALARICVAVFHGLVLQQAWGERLDLAACIADLRLMLEHARSPSRSAGTDRAVRLVPPGPRRAR